MTRVRAAVVSNTKSAVESNMFSTEDVEVLSSVTEPLLQWYEINRRRLPWRNSPSAYHVWVSEIMLQQTRVEAVRDYYRRFLETLPDVYALAEADEEVLLKLWEGLGYYNRIRNMQKAARIVVGQYGGQFPADYDRLLELPGIGSYTAGAVASIAYGIVRPAVDGNVLRVVMRMTECGEDIARQQVKRAVEEILMRIMPEDRPGAYNQALMELGATVCLPNGAPLCEKCPVSNICSSYTNGTMLEYPYKAPKKERRVEERTVFIIQDADCTVLHRRAGKGLLAGLYEFPNVEGYMDEKQALDWVVQEGFSPLRIERLPQAKHIFSHIEWRMQAYRIKVCDMGEEASDAMLRNRRQAGWLVVHQDKIVQEIPVPSAFSAYREYAAGQTAEVQGT